MRRLATLVLVLLAAPSARAVIFNDGLVHVIDASNSYPDEIVRVEEGPGGAITTVIVLEGAEVGTACVCPMQVGTRGRAEILGGDVDRVSVFGFEASLAIAGGYVRDVGIGGGSLELYGGVVDRLDIASPAANVAISGGVIGSDVRSQGPDTLISGGEIFGDVTIEGGITDPSRTTISGGRIYGTLEARDASNVEIVGTGFNLPPGPIARFVGTLRGILNDETPLDHDFYRSPTATITLIDSLLLAFDDGLLHVIDSPLDNSIELLSPQGGGVTTLELPEGGSIARNLTVRDGSVASLLGGTIEGNLFSAGTLVASDGFVGGDTTLAGGQAFLSGATLFGDLSSTDAELEVSGGGIGGDVLIDGGSATITGGYVLGDLSIEGDAAVLWSGGLALGNLYVAIGAVATIEGASFNYPFGPISDSVGALRGTLMDGTEIDVGFAQAPGALIQLVPEPDLAVGTLISWLALATLCARNSRTC